MDDGVEGGSWDRIEEWSMERVEALRSSRRRNGPSLRTAALAIGSALGVDWSKLAISQSGGAPMQDTPQGQTIAEIAAMAPKPL